MKESKKDKLLQWMWSRKVFNTVDIDRYGIDMFYTSAKRRVRQMAEECRITGRPIKGVNIQRLTDAEAILCGHVKESNQRLSWYVCS